MLARVLQMTEEMYVRRLLFVVAGLLVNFACQGTAADVSMASATEKADCTLVQVDYT